MRKTILSLFLLLTSLALVPPVAAQQMLMARSDRQFEVAMDLLQNTIREYGYTVAHVQKCDGGMAEFNYKTDFYRVVFFGKIGEVRALSEKYPELVPYLPLKIALFAEKQETVFAALNPVDLADYFTEPEVRVQLMRWSNDIRSILNDIRTADPALTRAPPAHE